MRAVTDADFDADAFQAIATGDEPDPTPDDGAENHAAAEGGPEASADDVGSESTLREMLMNSDPEVALEDVEDPWNPEMGGTRRIYRAFTKMLDVDGMPAVVDLTIGVAEAVVQLRDHLPDDESDDVQEESGDVEDGPGDEAPDGPEGVPGV